MRGVVSMAWNESPFSPWQVRQSNTIYESFLGQQLNLDDFVEQVPHRRTAASEGS